MAAISAAAGYEASLVVRGQRQPPYSSLREILLRVIVETATHAGHLDICGELVDGAALRVYSRRRPLLTRCVCGRV